MTPRCCPPPPPPDPHADPDEEIARLAKALGHPARVKMLRFLLQREECMVAGIVEEVPLAQSTVSQHLKVLREAGFIHGEVDGARICYCADAGRLERLRGLLDALVPAQRDEASPPLAPTAGDAGTPVSGSLSQPSTAGAAR